MQGKTRWQEKAPEFDRGFSFQDVRRIRSFLSERAILVHVLNVDPVAAETIVFECQGRKASGCAQCAGGGSSFV
jgi:hypothetical protein